MVLLQWQQLQGKISLSSTLQRSAQREDIRIFLHSVEQHLEQTFLVFFQEVHSDEIEPDSAYILFYEQQGVDYSQFLPKTEGKKMADTTSMDEDFESDYKKYCVLQWCRAPLRSRKDTRSPLVCQCNED